MTFAEFLQVLGALTLTIGPVGTALEAIGTALGLARLVAFGQRLEALGHDLPKLVRGSRYTKQAEAERNAVVDSKAPRAPFLPLWCFVLCLGVVSTLFLPACAAMPGSQASPCSETSLGIIVADCRMNVARECVGFGDLEQCPAVHECDARVDAWKECQ
jgi:hypothetical protein